MIVVHSPYLAKHPGGPTFDENAQGTARDSGLAQPHCHSGPAPRHPRRLRRVRPDTFADWHKRALFDRMASLADIEHRYAIFEPGPKPRDKVLDATGFYRRGAFPSTAQRMGLYEPHALNLAMQAVRALEPDGVTHLIVASCTGFSAPGLDFQIMRAAGLSDSVQRTIVGFMGCFAAVNALKLADQIVRADPSSRVLVVNLELSSLHLQEDFQDVPKMLSFLLFA